MTKPAKKKYNDDGTLDINNGDRYSHVIKAALDDSNSSLLLMSLDHHIVFFNKNAFKLLKQHYGIVLKIGDRFVGVNQDDENNLFKNFESHFTQAITSETMVTSEYRTTSQETPLWFTCHYSPVFDQKVIIGIAIAIVDITERKYCEQIIERQNETLKDISWMQSHQTRQPISSILGLLSILDKTNLNEDNLEIVTLIEKEARKLDGLVRETVARANATGEQCGITGSRDGTSGQQ